MADLFLGTFLLSFLMQNTLNEILSVSTYKLFEYAATCGGMFLFANWCKRYNKVAVFALKQIPRILLLIAIILLGVNASQYVIGLGILYGIGSAMYHLPINTMVGDKSNRQNIGLYMGAKVAITHTVKVAVPVVLGFFIDTGSFINVAYVLLVLSLLELGLMPFLSSSRHRCQKSIDFRGFFKYVMRFPVIRNLFLMEALRGFGTGLLASVITMYTVFMFKTNLNLGIFTTLFSLCSIVTSWLLGRYGKRKYYSLIIWLGMFVALGGISLFLWRTIPETFLVYNFVYATAIVAIDQLCSVSVFALAKSKCITENYKVEYFVTCDLALFIGRWIGYVGLLYIGVFGGYPWLRWYLVVITASMMLTGLLTIRTLSKLKER